MALPSANEWRLILNYRVESVENVRELWRISSERGRDSNHCPETPLEISNSRPESTGNVNERSRILEQSCPNTGNLKTWGPNNRKRQRILKIPKESGQKIERIQTIARKPFGIGRILSKSQLQTSKIP